VAAARLSRWFVDFRGNVRGFGRCSVVGRVRPATRPHDPRTITRRRDDTVTEPTISRDEALEVAKMLITVGLNQNEFQDVPTGVSPQDVAAVLECMTNVTVAIINAHTANAADARARWAAIAPTITPVDPN
jgi:hypothetical protein